MVAQEIARREYQVIEIEKRGSALVLAEQVHDGHDQRHEAGEHMGGDGLLEGCPSPAAKGVMSTGRVVQPLRLGLGQARALCGRYPLPLLAIRPKSTRSDA